MHICEKLDPYLDMDLETGNPYEDGLYVDIVVPRFIT